MCGIVGCIAAGDVVPLLLAGLRRLEYRGYDSAGIAVVTPEGRLAVRRRVGKLIRLVAALEEEPLAGSIGIGHTRWATHGGVTEANAHPHVAYDGQVAVIHNGIVENHRALREELQAQGIPFRSETDTEVLAHLVARARAEAPSLLAAVCRALRPVRGTYALVVLDRREPDRLVCARQASPLVLGTRGDAAFVASDAPALLAHTREVVFLRDGEVAEVRPGSLRITTLAGRPVAPGVQTIPWDLQEAEKGGFPHFMLKEIHEQPRCLTETLLGRVAWEEGRVRLEAEEGGELLPPGWVAELERVLLLACGTSRHAGLVAARWFEELAAVPAQSVHASEFRYGATPLSSGTLAVAVSQSGETADTLAALREAGARGARTLAVVNAVGSSLTREAERVLYTRAGPEIGVASTKAFTTQLAALFLLAHAVGRERGTLSPERGRELLAGLRGVPRALREALRGEEAVAAAAARLKDCPSFLFLGRGYDYPVALEGALKLKEISYLHAEGYPAGEMKHGPIALIGRGFPVVAVATPGRVYEKTLANLEEVRARGARVLAVGPADDERLRAVAEWIFPVPALEEVLTPIAAVVPLQLLAYHVARLRGCDIDQPRNLAKSVTVE